MSDEVALVIWDSTGTIVTYDSSAENTLFYVEELSITASQAQAVFTKDYPQYAGQKLAAFLDSPSPFNTNTDTLFQVQSCRVTYPGGVPRLQVFFQGGMNGYPDALTLADGYVLVFWTGAPQ